MMMRLSKECLTVLFLLTALMGCKTLTEKQEYIEFLNDPDNRITQAITIGEVKASMKWMPADLRRLLGTEKKDETDTGHFYFDARFDRAAGEKPGKEKTIYLDFDMQKDFVLWTGMDSLAPVICQKIENGLPGSYEYMLVFSPGPGIEEKGFTIFYHDKIFGIGTVAFVYSSSDIKRIPRLKEKNPNEVSQPTN